MFFKSKLEKMNLEMENKLRKNIEISIKQRHEYHQAREDRMKLLNRLDGEISAKKEYIQALNDQFQMPKNIINQLLQILKDKNIKIDNTNSN